VSFRVAFLLPIWIAILCGCAVVDPVDSRYDTVDRSLAKARNEAILLNLVRASHDYPLSFVTVANVTPSLTNTTALGLPAFLLGPKTALAVTPPYGEALLSSSTAANSTAVSTNFNISTQETSAFYVGFLKPIDLTTLTYFIRQGYPSELLFWLFTDSFELTEYGHTFGYRYDPPSDFGCDHNGAHRRCFLDWVLIATLVGLTVEERTAAASGPGAGKGAKTTFARFCFSQVLAQRAKAAIPAERQREIAKLIGAGALSPKCGSAWNPLAQANTAQSDILPLQVGGHSFKIIPRSAYGVFEFLGAIMKLERRRGELPELPLMERADAGETPKVHTTREDNILFNVVRGSDEKCFVQTRFYDGDYCVPEHATNTKRIFSLLAQLIAIQTAPTDLSITPIVRVVQ